MTGVPDLPGKRARSNELSNSGKEVLKSVTVMNREI
jgi:hypothetical protein